MARPRSLLATLLPLMALHGAWASPSGIPVCAPGTQTCGLAGCYAPMFAACVASQCFPKLLGLVSSSPIACLPYMNSCNGGTAFCSTGSSCVGGACAPTAASAAAAAAPGEAGAAPLAACAAARAQQQACSRDATPLMRASGAKLGYADTPDSECFESAGFKCCAVAGARGIESIVHSCKGSAILESAVSTLVNGTNTLLQSVGAAVAAGNGTAGNGTAGGALGGGGQQQALLTPLLQGVANVVTNMSQVLLAPLNVRINSSAAAARAKAAAAAAPAAAPPPTPGHAGYPSSAGASGVSAALVGALLLLALVL